MAQLSSVVTSPHYQGPVTPGAGHHHGLQVQSLRLREVIRALVSELVGGGRQAVKQLLKRSFLRNTTIHIC